MSTPVRVMVVQSDVQLRQGLTALIEGTPGLAYLGACADGSDLRGMLEKCSPDVVVMDVSGSGDLEAIRESRHTVPDATVLALMPDDDERLIFESLRAGVRGCLVTSTPPARILEAIAEVLQGGLAMSPGIASRVGGFCSRVWRAVPVEGVSLSRREKEVLTGLAEGRTYEEISRDLSVSVNTVRFYVRSVYRKLKARTQGEAVAKGLRMGLF